VIAGGITLAAVFISHRSASAQADISPEVWQQIGELLQEKQSRTPAQLKLDSQLVYARKESLKERLTASIDVMPALGGLDRNASGVLVDVRTQAAGNVAAAISQLGGTILTSSTGGLRARVPLEQLEALAALPDVQAIKPAARARRGESRLPPQFSASRKPSLLTLERLLRLISPVATLSAAGSLTTQGDIAHASKTARATYGVNGSSVRVGVLSDSAEATNFLIGTGDLPAGTTIVQDIIDGPGSSEGTAMMEIVYDMAPGVQLFFASAFNGPDSFADNIRTLRNVYHCDVIVDDVSYSDEAAFQDGTIARAVNDVTADGAVYLSSAGNGGNLTNGNSSAWEGDFVDAGPSPSFPGYRLHSFGPATFNRLLITTGVVNLFWSDPLGASANDYDLFVVNAAGTALLAASTSNQNGTQDPFEEVFRPAGFPANSRIVIAAFGSAAPRALHVENFFGEPLQIATAGVTRGHNAGASTVGVAAVAWNSARMGTRPFVGGAQNPTEIFSSDGPRKIFFYPDGRPITPGNLLYGSNGGLTLIKPDIAAADGVTTRTPGFNPFFGTSAAAPHAAAIAALILSKNSSLTANDVKNLMRSTALDIRAVGIDRDSGYGIVMASTSLAVQ
jgi:subtilisin family serine protease